VLGEPTDQAAGGRADDCRCQQRGREQPDDEPEPAAALHAFASEVIAGFIDRDLAVRIHGDQRDALHFQLLVCDQLHQPAEVIFWPGPGSGRPR
jgi:hypothetical protein